MAIVGLGVVTLLEIFSLGLRLGLRSSEVTEAISYDRQLMDDLFIRRQVRDGKEEGSIGDRHPFTLEVMPLGDERQLISSSGWELKQVRVETRYREGERERRIEMQTLRLVKKTP